MDLLRPYFGRAATGVGAKVEARLVCLGSGAPRPHCRLIALQKLHDNEEGAAYSTSIALALPLYVVIMAVFIQLLLLLITHLGLSYAAFAGARAASVWYSTDVPAAVAAGQVRRAVWNAATPFVSGDPRWRPATLSPDAEKYAQAYAAWSGSPLIALAHIAAKRSHAEAAVIVTDSMREATRRSCRGSLPPEVAITVDYKCPIPLAVAGRILGQRTTGPRGAGFTRTLSATVTLAVEHPVRTDASFAPLRKCRLGVRYDDLH